MHVLLGNYRKHTRLYAITVVYVTCSPQPDCFGALPAAVPGVPCDELLLQAVALQMQHLSVTHADIASRTKIGT